MVPLHLFSIAPPLSTFPPLKQLCCFGPTLKAVLITGTERRSEWQAGSILLKPNERNLCRVWGLQRPEEAVPLPIVLLLLSSLFCRLFIPSLNLASLLSSLCLSVSVTIFVSHSFSVFFFFSLTLYLYVSLYLHLHFRWCVLVLFSLL